MIDEIVLIVDDDTAHLSLVERYASLYGVKYKSFTNVFESICFMETHPVSLVITDMVMPEMDGMQLLLHTKQHYPATDVVVMTGFSQQYSYIDVIKAGATDFISKPFQLDEFSAKLERIFRERQTLKELSDAKIKAEASNHAKSDFVHRISHEFKTPLTNLVGFTDLLIHTDIQSKQIEYKEILAESVERLTELIGQLLDFSYLSEKKSEQKSTQFNLSDFLEDIVTFFAPQAKIKEISLNYTVEEALVGKFFLGETVALKNILHHLLKNALTFTDGGEVYIEVTGKEQLADESCLLQFAVHDSGCGIAEDQFAIIFEPFTQVEEFLTRRHEGTGLGLAICAQLISSFNNGKIWVESQPGKGSTFYFTLDMKIS